MSSRSDRACPYLPLSWVLPELIVLNYAQVETENLKQKYEQLVQAEADGRAITKAKLERFRAHRDREVCDTDFLLLLLLLLLMLCRFRCGCAGCCSLSAMLVLVVFGAFGNHHERKVSYLRMSSQPSSVKTEGVGKRKEYLHSV